MAMDGHCRSCGAKLSLLQRLQGQEFCTPAHRAEFQREQETMAIARLQQNAVTLGRAPAAKPGTRPAGRPTSSQPRLAPVESWPSAPDSPPPSAPAQADPAAAGFLSLGWAGWVARTIAPDGEEWDFVWIGPKPGMRLGVSLWTVSAEPEASPSLSGIVRWVPDPCPGDVWTILSVRYNPCAFVGARRLPPAPIRVEGIDWEGLDRRLNQAPDPAGPLRMAGARARVWEPWPREADLSEIDWTGGRALPPHSALAVVSGLAPSDWAGLVRMGAQPPANTRTSPAPLSIGSVRAAGRMALPRAHSRPRLSVSRPARPFGAETAAAVMAVESLPLVPSADLARPGSGVGVDARREPARSASPTPLQAPAMFRGARLLRFAPASPAQSDAARPWMDSGRSALRAGAAVGLGECAASALEGPAPLRAAPAVACAARPVAGAVAPRGVRSGVGIGTAGIPPARGRSGLAQVDPEWAGQPWFEPLSCEFGGQGGVRHGSR
jgi:hypothetical protein